MDKTDYQDIIGTKIKQIICDFLKDNPRKRYSTLDLNKELNIAQSSLSVNLNALEKVGILSSEKVGKFKYYWMEEEIAKPLVQAYEHLENTYAMTLERRSKKFRAGKDEKEK